MNTGIGNVSQNVIDIGSNPILDAKLNNTHMIKKITNKLNELDGKIIAFQRSSNDYQTNQEYLTICDYHQFLIDILDILERIHEDDIIDASRWNFWTDWMFVKGANWYKEQIEKDSIIEINETECNSDSTK